MNKNIRITFLLIVMIACRKNVEKTHPSVENISESVYASGILKSKNQYQVYSAVNGILQDIFVSEGDTIKPGTPLLTISNETSKLNTENEQLAADFADYNSNSGKLNELKINIGLAKSKMINDSLLLNRQNTLWAQQIGSKFEFLDLDLRNSSEKRQRHIDSCFTVRYKYASS